MSWHPGGPVGDPHESPGYTGRNRQPSKGGPSGVQRSSASQLNENEPLFDIYEHLQGLDRCDAALTMLRKVASTVKPIMRKHGWRVHVLAEFLPKEQNLLGLNVNKGSKICIRLRYHNNPDLFLPIDQVVDTMLHELSHNVWGEHDSNFHKLWDELRDEHEALVRKGYTGEGFLSEGKRLGGIGGRRMPPPHEMRRLAQASAEKRKAQGALTHGSGQRLGGAPLHNQPRDIRQIIADQVARRNTINTGCGSNRNDVEKLSQSTTNTFKTKDEEDDANNRAIAQALYDLMEREEELKLHGDPKPSSNTRGGGLAWSPEHGLYDSSMSLPSTATPSGHPSEEEQLRWAMQESMQPPSSSASPSRPTSAPPVPLETKPVPPSEDGSIESNPATKRKRPATPSISSPTHPIKHEMIDQQSMKAESEPLIDLSTIPGPNDTVPDDQWACEICTCINPLQFLACDACGVERPRSVLSKSKPQAKPTIKVKAEYKDTARKGRWEMPPPKQTESMGWSCNSCGAFMEHKWWTCSACGTMKTSS